MALTKKDRDEGWENEEQEEYVYIEVPEEYRKLPVERREGSVRDLFSRIITGDILLEPEFQRHYVWDQIRASRFIESLLLGIPIPPIFLTQESNGSLVVIDGHQRLETIFRFLQPLTAGVIESVKHSGDEIKAKPFSSSVSLKLKGCEACPELNGRGVEALSTNDRAKLWEYKIPVVEIKNDAHRDLKYLLFARLNQGSMTLNPQELRNCLYHGTYNRLLQELEAKPEVLKLFGRKEPDKRMKDRERILTFYAFSHRFPKYKSPMRYFLNVEMEENRFANDETIKTFRLEYLDSVQWVNLIFGGEAFRIFNLGDEDNITGYWSRRRMDLIYEVEMVGFCEFRGALKQLSEGLDSNARELFKLGLRFTAMDIMTRKDFRDTLAGGTKMEHIVRLRYGIWNNMLKEVTGNPSAVISRAKKVIELMRRSNICAICPKSINSTDDAKLIQTKEGVKIVHRCHKEN